MSGLGDVCGERPDFGVVGAGDFGNMLPAAEEEEMDEDSGERRRLRGLVGFRNPPALPTLEMLFVGAIDVGVAGKVEGATEAPCGVVGFTGSAVDSAM